MADVAILEATMNLGCEVSAEDLRLNDPVCRVCILVVHTFDFDLDRPRLGRCPFWQDGRHAIIKRNRRLIGADRRAKLEYV